jgi:hypothetical protein
VPDGGSTGQVLAKASATDQDTAWIAPPADGQGVPTGGAAGQGTKILMGVGAAWLVAVGWLATFGEYPERWSAGILLVTGYLVIVEILLQRPNGVDSLEDTAAFGLGVWGVLYVFSEVQIGDDLVCGRPPDLAPVFLSAVLFLAFGIMRRIPGRKVT